MGEVDRGLVVSVSGDKARVNSLTRPGLAVDGVVIPAGLDVQNNSHIIFTTWPDGYAVALAVVGA